MSTEMMKEENTTTQITAIASNFLRLSTDVRTAISKVIREQPYAAGHAMLSAQFMLEDAMDEQFKAYILKCVTKGKLGTVSGPTNQEIFSVVAEAAARGLTFGKDEFYVWKGGRLYIQANGYRKLFAMRGDCSVPRVDPGVPEWRVLKEKSMWVCDGRGKVVCNGETIEIERSGEYKFGINGNATDGIANISGKVERAILKRLWEMVSAVEVDSISEEADAAPMDVKPHGKIESKPAAADPWAVEYGRLTSPRAQDAWQYILNAPEVAAIDMAERSLGKLEATGPEKQSLKRFAEHRRDVLKGVV